MLVLWDVYGQTKWKCMGVMWCVCYWGGGTRGHSKKTENRYAGFYVEILPYACMYSAYFSVYLLFRTQVCLYCTLVSYFQSQTGAGSFFSPEKSKRDDSRFFLVKKNPPELYTFSSSLSTRQLIFSFVLALITQKPLLMFRGPSVFFRSWLTFN